MKKSKTYKEISFSASSVAEMDKAFRLLAATRRKKVQYLTLEVEVDDAKWTFDTFKEFIAGTHNGAVRLSARSADGVLGFSYHKHPEPIGFCSVIVEAPTRDPIESVFQVVEKQVELYKQAERDKSPGRVFIGHGRSPQWQELRHHLQDKHAYEIEAYEIGSRAAYTIIQNLKGMLEKSQAAILVMTGEDKMSDGSLRARQNVIHEIGLFQGKLGFERAVVLREASAESFSNLAGVDEIRFPVGGIKESISDALAFLRRELK